MTTDRGEAEREGTEAKSTMVRIGPSPEPETARQQPGHDEMFCSTCGRVIKKEAALCVGCGVPTGRNVAAVAGVGPPPRYNNGQPGRGEGKSKAAAIVLAVLLGTWTWLYTYREDNLKFWVTLAAGFVMFILTLLTLGIFLLIAVPIWIGIYIWAIVDTATKSDAWYLNY
jgi:hypothetical protein